MEDAPDLDRTGERIERLLDELRGAVDPRAYGAVEDLVRALTDLYGAGLERIVRLARQRAPELLDRLVGDELVAALLVVHGLHPDDLESRVQAALQSVRPFLAHHDGDVELVALDPELGAVKLRLLGSCDGCPSSSVTLQHAVEQAIHDAAPEVTHIDVDNDLPAAPVMAGIETPVTLMSKPLFDACPAELSSAAVGAGTA